MTRRVLLTSRTPWISRALNHEERDEHGFTLIELLFAVVLVPVVVGAITIALLSVFSLQGGVSNRISDSADAQLVSSTFESDVQSATSVTTSPTAACGSSTQILGLKWANGTTVSYSLLGKELVRSVCQPGTSVPSTTSVVSHDAPSLGPNLGVTVSCNATLAAPLLSGSVYTALSVSPLPAPVALGESVVVGSTGSTTTFIASAGVIAGKTTVPVNTYTFTPTTQYPVGSQVYPLGAQVNDPKWTASGFSGGCGTDSGWISTLGVTGVTFSIKEPASNYVYQLVGLPGASSSQNPPSSTGATPTTSCGFASPGTGTYASTMCFVDLSALSQPTFPPSSGCQQVTAAVTGTTYTMSFCITASGGPVAAASIPTYFDPPTSEAFLGNNNFYTGIPGNPALYQECEGGSGNYSYCNGNATSVVTITNIQVLESNGAPAAGWQLVTGDAESTDTGESIAWASNQPLNLLPNSPSSPYGNACATSTSPPYLPQLTGLGTTAVSCSATVSSDKTGTVMLEAVAPTTAPLSLTVTMVDGGLEAMFIGMILP